jgi:phospholipid N-methyltransferase
MRYWTECREFYRQFRQQYRNTGSILPSGRPLARALASEFRRRAGPAHVLEVGPGTGAVTAQILRQMRPDDRLDIVEINEHFVALLRRRFEQEPLFRSRRDRVRLFHAPLQEVLGEGVYDFLISGLPLNNFPLALVREIFQAYRRLLKPGGVLSYFEYLGIRRLKGVFVGRRERRHLHVLGRFLGRRLRAYEFRHQDVLLNVPPAVARHLRFTV